MTFNPDGVRFINERTKPLAVASMAEAANIIADNIRKALEKGVHRVDLADENDRLQFARHVAWIIGFDALTDQRREIHSITKLLVGEPS